MFKKAKSINFYKDFSEKNVIPDFYNKLFNKTNSKEFLKYNKINNKNSIIINFVPSYIDLQMNPLKQDFKYFKVFSILGFLADFKNYISFDEYLKSQLNSKRRKSLRSQLRKLDNCYNTKYKVYIGDINQSHYNFLIDELKLMIINRFEERGETHANINNWSFYKESVYNMILQKRACLFVIYNEEKPIAISINYLNQEVFFGAMDSYDIHYSKFSLGNILMIKKMEWCFENGFTSLDMGYGYLKYKYEWSNTIYKCYSHIFYKKKNFISQLKAYLVCKLLLFKNNFKKTIGISIYYKPDLTKKKILD